MGEINNEENFFRTLLSESKLNVPFSDFEDDIMQRIHQVAKKKPSASREFKLALIFFLVGSLFGIIISIILPKLQEPFLGIYPDKLVAPFQVIFAFLFITQFDNLAKFYKERNASTPVGIRKIHQAV